MGKRNIFISRFDHNFNPKRDIDLGDFRYLLTTTNLTDEERERCYMYICIVGDILLHSQKWVGYSSEIKNEILTRGFFQSVFNKQHFDGETFTAKSAPFYYIYRIIYSMACHTLKEHYRQRFIPFSQMENSPESTMTKQVYDDNDEKIKEPLVVDYFTEQDPPADIFRWRINRSVRTKRKHSHQLHLHLF